MQAYMPTSLFNFILIIALLILIQILSFTITRWKFSGVRIVSWLFVATAFITMNFITQNQPAGLRMLAFCGALLFSLKSVVGVADQLAGAPQLKILPWFSFATLWGGMNPSLFTTLGQTALPNVNKYIWRGIKQLILGFAFVFVARISFDYTKSYILMTALLLPGLSLIVHFGIFNILTGVWRKLGVDCRVLFDAPLISTSLSEFWGRRWNLAFSEMTRIAVYRPLTSRMGKSSAALVGFLFSGALHELAISFPVRAGYGLPFAYFLLHGMLLLIERTLDKRGYAIDRATPIGRIWSIIWLVLPMPILFHPPFLKGVVWPIIGIYG